MSYGSWNPPYHLLSPWRLNAIWITVALSAVLKNPSCNDLNSQKRSYLFSIRHDALVVITETTKLIPFSQVTTTHWRSSTHSSSPVRCLAIFWNHDEKSLVEPSWTTTFECIRKWIKECRLLNIKHIIIIEQLNRETYPINMLRRAYIEGHLKNIDSVITVPHHKKVLKMRSSYDKTGHWHRHVWFYSDTRARNNDK